MQLYALTIFLSAFLLFQVQPIMGRSILPWFGGSAAVWTTCLLFFQVLLLAGYLYAHLLVRYLSPRRQACLHMTLLGAALLFLPIIPQRAAQPFGADPPLVAILQVLGTTVGIPYLLLAATSPLLQAWYSRTHSAGMPYRLFALSNTASLLALVTYPPLVEPHLSLRLQEEIWSGGFVLYAAACALTAWRAAGVPQILPPERCERVVILPVSLWILLPAAASAMLLAVTTHITQNIAAIPFLWIVPLVLYLLSFIICFEREAWYDRTIWFPLAGGGIVAMAAGITSGPATPQIVLLVSLFSLALFACCMLCHGELARLKPPASRLTSFYLCSSLGGGIGGIFVGVLSPLVFQRYLELPVTLVATAVFCCTALLLNPPPVAPLLRRGLTALVPVVAVAPLWWFAAAPEEEQGRRHFRNFYGVLTIADREDEEPPRRILVNGVIQHGAQSLAEELRRVPTTYYGRETGVGQAMAALNGARRVEAAVVGLGVGTMAAYGRPGDRITFYEINPLVRTLARSEFSYLKDSQAEVEVVMGDARLSLERERERRFDLLAVDAFSGDSIPTHLLTREAIGLYLRRLKPDGILAVHISNRYLDLEPVLAEVFRELGIGGSVVESRGDAARIVYGATWVLASREPRRLPPGRALVEVPGFRCWTDDYCDLFSIVKR